MVLGNLSSQRGHDPVELTAWFTDVFVDGTPRVMRANAFGMSQHADGGIVATKPYAERVGNDQLDAIVLGSPMPHRAQHEVRPGPVHRAPGECCPRLDHEQRAIVGDVRSELIGKQQPGARHAANLGARSDPARSAVGRTDARQAGSDDDHVDVLGGHDAPFTYRRYLNRGGR